MQITQFIVGATYAFAHLFVAYSRPVSVPYVFIHNLSSALPVATSTVSSAISSVSATADLESWLKKAVLRAAGQEGLAENVRNSQGQTFGIDAVHAAEVEKAAEEIRYKSEYQITSCLDTPGQTFAILLNLVYLAPLTVLFLRFFTQKYLTATKQRVPPERRREVAKDSAKKAIKNLETEIKEAMDEEQHADEGTMVPDEVKAKVDSAKAKLDSAKAKLDEAKKESRAKAGEKADATKSKVADGAEKARESASDIADQAKEQLKKDLEALRNKGQGAKEKTAEQVDDGKKEAESKANDVKVEAGEAKDKAAEKKDDAKRGASQTRKENKSPQKSKIPKRDLSPQKRDPSPQKKDPKPATNGNTDKPAGKENDKGLDGAKDEDAINGLDESAYEVNPDEIKNEEEQKAEQKMQPGGS